MRCCFLAREFRGLRSLLARCVMRRWMCDEARVIIGKSFNDEEKNGILRASTYVVCRMLVVVYNFMPKFGRIFSSRYVCLLNLKMLSLKF